VTGAIVEENVFDDVIKRIVTFPTEEYASDYSQQNDLI